MPHVIQSNNKLSQDEEEHTQINVGTKKKGVKNLVSKYEKKQTNTPSNTTINPTTNTAISSSSFSDESLATNNKHSNDLINTGRVSKLFYDKNDMLFTSTSDMPLTTTSSTFNTPGVIKKLLQNYETTSSTIQTETIMNNNNSKALYQSKEDDEENSSLGTVSTLEERKQKDEDFFSLSHNESKLNYETMTMMTTTTASNISKNRRSSSLATGLVNCKQEVGGDKMMMMMLPSTPLINASHVFRNEDSNLTAVLYLADQFDRSNFKVFLKGNLI